tara:strand:+ start:235 stop:480 length:246 start_codon:yes stop_codon:yes gene_type:complete
MQATKELVTSVDKLKMAYQFKQEEIDKHKQHLVTLEQELKVIRDNIVKNCQHCWVYEAPAVYERGYYYCSDCGVAKKIILQ